MLCSVVRYHILHPVVIKLWVWVWVDLHVGGRRGGFPFFSDFFRIFLKVLIVVLCNHPKDVHVL